jgi:hypothetical protein
VSDRRLLKPAALFPAPDGAEVHVQREPVEGECDACGATRLERYPVLRVTGWCEVVRCPACLAILASSPAPTPFGFTYVPYGAYLRDQLKRS